MSNYRKAFKGTEPVILMLHVDPETGNKSWTPTEYKTLEEAQQYDASQLSSEPEFKDPLPQNYNNPKARININSSFKRHKAELMGIPEDKSAVDRYNEARNMPFIEKAPIVLGRQLDKLGAGTMDMFNIVDKYTSPTQATRDEYDKAMVDRANDQRMKDELYKQMGQNEGAATLMNIVPYIGTGVTLGPKTAQLGANTLKGINTTKQMIAGEAGGLTVKGIESLAQKPGIIGKAAERINRESVAPRVRAAAQAKAQPPISNPYFENLGGRLLGDAALGGIEGLLHYDETPLGGLISSLAGSAVGAKLKPSVSKSPDFWDAAERDVRDWAKDQGMKFLPGTEKGINSAHMFEEGLRSESSWSDLVKMYDRRNAVVANKVGYRAMGLVDTKGNPLDVTPDMLREHMDSLRKEYQDLEIKTRGRIDRNDISQLEKEIGALKNSISKEDEKAFKEVVPFFEKLKKASKVTRNARGRFVKATFPGKDYQALSSDLQKKINSMKENNHLTAMNKLIEFKKILDTGIERGIKDMGGEPTLNAWKDLNERYAMTKLMMDHGLDANMKVNPQRLHNFFMSNDSERLLQGKGGRVKDLHNLAKVWQMQTTLPGNANRTASVGNPATVSPGRRFLLPALSHTMVGKPLANLYMKAYQSKYSPVINGLGMELDDNSLWNSIFLGRASGQGLDIHRKAMDAGKDTYDYFERLLSSPDKENENK